MHKLSALVFAFPVIVSLGGCMAVALAPAAISVGGMVSGSMENVVKATVDEKTLTPEIRAAFSRARTLAMVAGDRSAIKAADLFETRGGYQVTIDRPTAKVGEMTGSERREALRKLCTSSKADLAVMGRTANTQTGNMLVGAITGRAKVKNDWIMDILNCRTQATHMLGGSFEFDGGIYNQKVQAEYEELIGAEIGSKILDAVGRSTAPAAASVEVSVTQSAAALAPAQPVADRPEARSLISVLDTQKKLLELGYAVGTPDGVMGRRTVEALRRFQQDQKIPLTGRIDAETSLKLQGASR